MGAKESENGWDSAFSQQAGQDTFSQEFGEQEQLEAKQELGVQRRVKVGVSKEEVDIEVSKKEVDIKVSKEEVDIKVSSSVQKRCRDPCEAEAR